MRKPEILECRLHAKVAALEQLDLMAMARQTDFVIREPRKLDLHLLAKSWLGLAGAGMPTLERLLGAMTLLGHASYSKQALSKHLRKPCDRFFSTLLMACMWNEAHQAIQQGRLRVAGRIWVDDSTTIALPDRFASDYPGCVNQSHRTFSQLKLQCVFDLAKLELGQFSLSGFTRNDQAAAGDILAVARTGDLVRRDLGYFALAVFATFRERSIHFLSRYRHLTALFKAWKSCLRLERLNTHSLGMLRFSVLTQLLLCALTLDLCAASRRYAPPDRPPSILRVAAIIANYSGLIACVVFQQSPAHLLDALLRSQGTYERRHDRKNAALRFAALFPLG